MPNDFIEEKPVIYAIGGPNGAGKTTFAKEFLPAEGIEHFLNADSIAAGLSPLRPEAMAIPAARLLLKRWRELVAARTSFAFESTFSGRTYAPMLRNARAEGYNSEGMLPLAAQRRCFSAPSAQSRPSRRAQCSVARHPSTLSAELA